jgi:hypothetical protein
MPNDPFQQFLAAYPVTRRKGGTHARASFYDALDKVPFALLLHALEQHKRSVQWQNPRFIPSMTTWLNDEMWIQTLPEPAAPTLSPADQQRRWASLAPGDQLRRLK